VSTGRGFNDIRIVSLEHPGVIQTLALPVPGDRGTAVIFGHVDSRAGPAVFFRLRELRTGDVLLVTPRGRPTARYRVQRSEDVSKDRFPTRRVYRPSPYPSLRLVTCTGPFDRVRGHYRDNLVVYAKERG
jgi:LPXTG-site transpeptidase (sortase) family protein